jgi:glutamate decarboxylase
MLHKKKSGKDKEDFFGHASTYSTRFFDQPVPKYRFPEKGMPANAAYQLVHDEMNLDGNPAQNLASFNTTWMEEEANKLIMENINKNFIDHDEYPQTEVIHERMVNMLARLFNSPPKCQSVGTATIGSSEAIMLGLLAHKWTWKKRRQAAGQSYNKPNVVFGADAHICWDKFARYFDVEMRMIPMVKDRFIISVDEVAKNIDENTICVGAILGTTFTGQADPIKEINDYLVKIKKDKGWDIPLHVDGASGGMIAPFVYPDLLWDFRLEQVKSINVSGHKYGLTYPGLGWIIWRDAKDLPEDIIFTVNYLGGKMPTYTLNFSRGSAMVIAQYYNFLRLGKEGYAKIMNGCVSNAKYLSEQLAATDRFEMLNKSQMLPIVALKLKDTTNFSVYDLSAKLRERGWIISAYTLPPQADDIAIMRIVVREHFSRDLAEILLADIKKAIVALDKIKPQGANDPEADHKNKKPGVC